MKTVPKALPVPREEWDAFFEEFKESHFVRRFWDGLVGLVSDQEVSFSVTILVRRLVFGCCDAMEHDELKVGMMRTL